MDSNAGMIVRVTKRLKAAVGYHELGMTQHALRCLDSLDLLGKIGPFGVVQDVLRDVFITNPENRVSAANALEVVARMLSTPARHAIQLTLAACYGQVNERSRTANMALARGAKIEVQTKPASQAQHAAGSMAIAETTSIAAADCRPRNRPPRMVDMADVALVLVLAAFYFLGPLGGVFVLVLVLLVAAADSNYVPPHDGEEPNTVDNGKRKTIRYADITGVEVGRTRIIDGWGVHYVPRRGWTYNLWGFGCVKLTLGRKIIRVGTDDAEELVNVVREKMGSSGLSNSRP